jgi:hypothetical protein
LGNSVEGLAQVEGALPAAPAAVFLFLGFRMMFTFANVVRMLM